MKNKYKIILFKIVIVLVGVFLFAFAISYTASKKNLDIKLDDFYEKLNYITGIPCGFFGALMFIFIFCVDIRPEKTKPEKYKLISNDYKEIKKIIGNNIFAEGYSEFKTYKNDLFQIDYAIKKRWGCQYILAMLNLEELTEEIYAEYKKSYFEDFGNHLMQCGYIVPEKDISITYVICVKRKNNTFINYTQKNVYQMYMRYNLPVGIDCQNKMMYIATQNEGIAPNRYNKLKRMFKKYVENILEKNKTS